MVQSKGGKVAQELEVLWSAGTVTGASDAQLLQRFTLDRDATAELAFRELLERHAPMVMGVCRQIVRRPQDADDAFQATFLVLVRKARSMQVRESIGPWLYKVAYRTALRARVYAARHAPLALDDIESSVGSPSEVGSALETAPLLHDEIGRLPEKYRSPIVLCHLEGKTHEEAARVLNWPVGTLSGRLSRGRALLKGRLERRGLAVPMAAVARPFLNLGDLPPGSLIASTLKSALLFAASQPVAPNVLSLTQGVLRNMLFQKFKTAFLAIVVVGSVSGVAGALALRAAQVQAPPDPNARSAAAAVQTNPNAPITIPLNPPAAQLRKGKNHPNLDHNPVLGMGSILVVKSQDGRAYNAWSDDVDQDVTGGWQRIAVPDGVKVTPIYTVDTVAFVYEGKAIEEIAAFSAKHGLWERVKLRAPLEGPVQPLLGNGFALYQGGNVFYAFSAEKGAWSVLEVAADATAPALTSWTENHLLVRQGKRLYAFSLKQGKWSMPVEMDVPAAKSK